MHLYPTINLCKTSSLWVSNHKLHFSAIRPTISELRKREPEHVQMYPTHELCKMHHGLVTKHTPNFVTIGLSIPELSLAANFYIPSLSTCQVPQWLPRWMGVGSIHGRRDVVTHQRRPFVYQARGCRDISRQKRHGVVSGPAAHT